MLKSITPSGYQNSQSSQLYPQNAEQWQHNEAMETYYSILALIAIVIILVFVCYKKK